MEVIAAIVLIWALAALFVWRWIHVVTRDEEDR